MEKNIDRRNFLKRMGAGAATIGMASALNSCTGGAGSALSENFNPSGSSNKPIGDMTFRINSNCGDKVSILGYGCMRWPNNPQTGEIDQEMVNRLVDTAMEHGVNYFDTSPAYLRGFSERATGIALNRHPRESYYIATKLSNFAEQQQSRENSIALYKKSFTELQVDYIDYMLLHSIGSSMENFEQRYIRNGILDFLVEEKKKGKIRNLGFSYHGDNTVFDHVMTLHDRGEYHWDFVQIQMNYVDWRHASGRNVRADYLYSELEKRGIPVVIMEPLLGGRLAKLPAHLAERLKSERPEDSIASWAFRFNGSFPGVMSVLSGMTYMEHLQDNLATFSPLEPCSRKEFTLLEEVATSLKKYPLVPCNACDYCMPCPYGIDIPGILTHYNSCVTEGVMGSGPGEDGYRRARRKYLLSYGRLVERERQADHCIGCGICNRYCPQGIDIPRELRRIDSYVESLKLQD